VRITAQLIQVRDQTHLWAEEYDRELRDMLALQRDVSSKIANHVDIRIRLTSAGRLSSTGTRPVNPIAYEDFLKGRYYLHKWLTQDDALERSKHYLEDAISADSDYAPAYAGLAQLYFLRVFARSPPREVMPLAEKFALKALALNDGVAEAHDILGAVKLRYYWDFPAAEREIKRALELDPSLPEPYSEYADSLTAMGRFEEALEENKRGSAQDPLWPEMNMYVGSSLLDLKRYDEALAEFPKILELEPKSGAALFHVAII
jgi:tetratricopeptide (TPR) repeat protein